MVKRLIRHGNSSALIIDKPILELLKITPDTPLEITTEGGKLIITPVRERMRPEVRAAYAKIAARHKKTLRRLAD